MTDQSGLTNDIIQILARLLLAGVIGAVLGYERQQRGQPKAIGIAGMMLVCIGSAAYMLLAQHLAGDDPSAPGRAVQSVLQGIGFLAGAVIFKGGTDVQGIKTATTIWIAAALGLAAATGLWWLSLLVGGMTALLLYLTDRLSAGPRQAESSGRQTNKGIGG